MLFNNIRVPGGMSYDEYSVSGNEMNNAIYVYMYVCIFMNIVSLYLVKIHLYFTLNVSLAPGFWTFCVLINSYNLYCM